MACNDVVSPLSTAPWAYTSRGDNEIYNILERNEKHRPIHKKMSCKSCQVNKKRTQKYGHLLPSRIIIRTPWEALCVDLVGPYTLIGKDGSSIDFMALTMIDPASSWFEVVELPTITRLMTRTVNGKEKLIKEEIFDKSSDQKSRLVNKIWLCRFPRCRYLIYDNGSELKLHFETLCDSYGIKCKPTTIKNPQANAICERVH